MALQQDGKVLCALDGNPPNPIIRLNQDGSLDNSYDAGTGANDEITSLVIQRDGGCIAAGQFTTFSGASRHHIVRLNGNGLQDASFNPSADGAVHDVLLQPGCRPQNGSA